MKALVSAGDIYQPATALKSRFVAALLKFSLVQSTRHDFAAPYASLSAGRHAAATANSLFTLSRFTDAGATTSESASDASQRAGSGSGAGSSSGYESGGESSSTSDLHLERIQCQLCHRPLSQRGGSKRFWQRSPRSQKPPNLFLVCDCCQRCFHEDCCKDKGISTHQDRKTGTWFHSSGCQDCHQGLKQQADAGSTPLPDGRSWQLVDCQPRSPKELGGVRALRELKANLGDVLEVLLAAYGPGAVQQLVNTGNGYAVLLRKQDKEPVTAGLLDVYGKDLAVLDLVATLSEEQGQGHCTALVGALEGWLGPQLGVASLMAVCPDNEPEVAKLWQSKFGFKRLTKKQLTQLQASVPPLNYYEDSLLLTKQLPNKAVMGSSWQCK
eukprot:gene10419-10577_t